MWMACSSLRSSFSVVSPPVPDAGFWNTSTFVLCPASQALIEHSRECQAGFFPGKCKVIHGEVWVKNSEWSCGVSLKPHCLVAWPLSSVLAPAAFFFFSQTFPLIQPSLACFFFMPVAPSPGTPEVYNSMWESSVERCELVINETNSDISLPECVVCVCTHEFQT